MYLGFVTLLEKYQNISYNVHKVFRKRTEKRMG